MQITGIKSERAKIKANKEKNEIFDRVMYLCKCQLTDKEKTEVIDFVTKNYFKDLTTKDMIDWAARKKKLSKEKKVKN